MGNINWAVVAAIISAAAAALGLIFQRIDIRKQNKYQREIFEYQRKVFEQQRRELEEQNKYQRNTFELQHRIEEDTKLFDIASDIASTVSSLCIVKDMLYTQTLERGYRWSKNVQGMRVRASGATIIADMAEIQYTESLTKLQELENKNKLLEEQFRNQISKIKINISTLDEELQEGIINKSLEFIKELDNMESAIKKLKELDGVDEEVIKNNENWAKQSHKILRQKVVEFQSIFINMKIDTYNKVEKIKKINMCGLS